MTDHDSASPAQEWSYHFLSDDVDQVPVQITISAPESTFPLLCNRLGLHSIEGIKADLTLSRNTVTKVITVDGRIQADVHQRCVVTDEPVLENVDDTFEAWFSEPSNAVSFTKAKRERTATIERNEQSMLEEYDDPEEVIGGKIDLGELVTQHLSLSLSPYPKCEGVAYDTQEAGLKDDDAMYENPFAALKAWKADEKKKDK
tara:strand:- start:33380 stop:33985 length:606 start_codon:yes stop_codon:yes gene_type:complete